MSLHRVMKTIVLLANISCIYWKQGKTKRQKEHKPPTFQRILAMQINPWYSDALTFSSEVLIGFYCCHKGDCSNMQLHLQLLKPWPPARDSGRKALSSSPPLSWRSPNLLPKWHWGWQSSGLLSDTFGKMSLYHVFKKSTNQKAPLVTNYSRLLSLES